MKIALVGEAYGAEEEAAKQPFIGKSGKLLNELLSSAGIRRSECFVTNAFNLRPNDKNDIDALFGPKGVGIGSPKAAGKYLLPQYTSEISRLHQELISLSPNIIVALGATATWAVLQKPIKISEIRGTLSWADSVNAKVLPTFHPAAVLRQWNLRPTVILDLMKAKRESESRSIEFIERELWIDPTLDDLRLFDEQHIANCTELSVDIETPSGQIDCVAFAPSKSLSLCVPFVDRRKPGNSYWVTEAEEVMAWYYVRKWLLSPAAKIGQNFLYDIQWLWRKMGLRVSNFRHDTMLKSHALFPELPKGLGFLGSIYCNERAWKLLGKYRTEDKRDE